MIRDLPSESPKPLVIAHRGACLVARENSVEAIRQARALGADWVELDVRLSRDGVAVLSHDERIAGRDVASLDAAEMKGEFLADSLSRALDAVGDMGVNLELKGPAADPKRLVQAVLAELDGFGGRPLISSFWPEIINAVPKAPNAGKGFLTASSYDPDARIAISSALSHGCEVALPEDRSVDGDVIEMAHSLGLTVITWTVDDPVRIDELASWKIDGIITNDPALARKTVG